MEIQARQPLLPVKIRNVELGPDPRNVTLLLPAIVIPLVRLNVPGPSLTYSLLPQAAIAGSNLEAEPEYAAISRTAFAYDS